MVNLQQALKLIYTKIKILKLKHFNQSLTNNIKTSFNSSVGRAQGWKLWGRWFNSNLKHINMKFKLYFKYILLHLNNVFLKHYLNNNKNTNVILTQINFYFLSLHLKFSSFFYSTQLIDLLSYELPVNLNYNNTTKKKSTVNNSILIYNFNSILYQQRFCIFIINITKANIMKKNINQITINSISELFANANWLERENAELHGIFFFGKKDLRNLLLQYGDTSAPMLKNYPSIGIREIFYDSVTDLLIQTPVSLQF